MRPRRFLLAVWEEAGERVGGYDCFVVGLGARQGFEKVPRPHTSCDLCRIFIKRPPTLHRGHGPIRDSLGRGDGEKGAVFGRSGVCWKTHLQRTFGVTWTLSSPETSGLSGNHMPSTGERSVLYRDHLTPYFLISGDISGDGAYGGLTRAGDDDARLHRPSQDIRSSRKTIPEIVCTSETSSQEPCIGALVARPWSHGNSKLEKGTSPQDAGHRDLVTGLLSHGTCQGSGGLEAGTLLRGSSHGALAAGTSPRGPRHRILVTGSSSQGPCDGVLVSRIVMGTLTRGSCLGDLATASLTRRPCLTEPCHGAFVLGFSSHGQCHWDLAKGDLVTGTSPRGRCHRGPDACHRGLFAGLMSRGP
mmetsp:Transcript_31726/g.111746  ORF Transcript_31726/g.111746 Transcript_31726/m.111746 type:complete len:360 (+) Transcript_31726:572-1651(+)